MDLLSSDELKRLMLDWVHNRDMKFAHLNMMVNEDGSKTLLIAVTQYPGAHSFKAPSHTYEGGYYRGRGMKMYAAADGERLREYVVNVVASDMRTSVRKPIERLSSAISAAEVNEFLRSLPPLPLPDEV